MKKTLMTFVAVGFGVSVAFAQNVAPAEENQETIQTQETEMIEQGEQERRRVELNQLPEAAQTAFEEGAFSNYEVLGIYETTSEPGEATVYEFELVTAGENSGDAAAEEEMPAVETEQVNERQPDMIIHIDENGEVVKEEDLDEQE